MTGVLIKRGDLEPDECREKTARRHREKTAIYKLRRETSEKINPADTLISDF